MSYQNDTIAESALRKIITAYGKKPPSTTRLQAFAKAARLSNDIQDKRSYPDIPERDRDLILMYLKTYAFLIRAQEVLESSFTYIPAVLSHRLLKWSEEISQQRPNPLPKAILMIALASKYYRFRSVFKDAYSEIENNPDQYPSQSMREFLNDIVCLSVKRPILKALFSHATGFMKDEFHYLLERFNSFSATHETDAHKQDVSKTYSPSVGPDTVEEFIVMMGILYQHDASFFRQGRLQDYKIGAKLNGHMILASGLGGDLTPAHLQDIFTKTRFQHASAHLRQAMINSGVSATIAIGMTRYFLERHGDKLHPLQRMTIEKSMRDLYLTTFEYNEEVNHTVGLRMSEQERSDAISTMFNETWAAWPRPSVDDMVSYYDSLLKGKKKERFFALLDSTADYFDLHVTYYAEQDETIRKLRRNIFKSGTIETGEDTARAEFLRQLAQYQSNSLLAAGFSEVDIHQIARTGRLYRKGQIDTTYNVDHIIDIHAGGTNSPSNLCLMPARLNDEKNQFLLLQTRVHGETDAGFWVLTMRPKMVQDGVYKPIILETYQANPEPREPKPN
jgi:hypothetical protein